LRPEPPHASVSWKKGKEIFSNGEQQHVPPRFLYLTTLLDSYLRDWEFISDASFAGELCSHE